MDATLQEQPLAGPPRPGRSCLDWLVTTRGLTPVLAERVARVQAETCDRLSGILLKLGLLSEPVLATGLAEYCGLDRLDAALLPAAPVPLAMLNAEFLRAREVVPLRAANEVVEIACWDPLDDYATRALEFALGKPSRG